MNSGVRVALAIAASLMVGCSLDVRSRLGLDDPVELAVAWVSSSKASTTCSGDCASRMHCCTSALRSASWRSKSGNIAEGRRAACAAERKAVASRSTTMSAAEGSSRGYVRGQRREGDSSGKQKQPASSQFAWRLPHFRSTRYMRQQIPQPPAGDRMSGSEGLRESRRESGRMRQGWRRVAPLALRGPRKRFRALPAYGRQPIRQDPGVPG
eukprot:1063393-Pleurochrysis_carterae.AAC.1